MSDFETRARAAADALGTEPGVGDPTVVRGRLRRRRALRVVVSSAAVVVVGIGAFAVARNDSAVRLHTVGSTGPTNAVSTTTRAEATTTSSPATTVGPPPTTALPAATAAPRLLVATDQGCVRRVLGTADVVAAATSDVRTCFALSDGSIVAERGNSGSPTVLTRFVAGRAAVDLPLTNPFVLGPGEIEGRAVLFVVLPPPPGADEAPITVYDIASGSRRNFGFGLGGDSGTSRVSTDGHVVVASENADMGVSARYYNVDGSDAAGPDLSAQMQAYPSQDVVQLVFSPDGKRLAYLDGPAFLEAGDSDPNGDWTLVVVDVATGHELQRTKLTTGQDAYTWLDYDGRWAVANRVVCLDGCAASAAVVVDTQAARPTPAAVSGAVGAATLDSAG